MGRRRAPHKPPRPAGADYRIWSSALPLSPSPRGEKGMWQRLASIGDGSWGEMPAGRGIFAADRATLAGR
nr:hypothetical protein SHINE37_44120 [Rhizobiaceae bacterium]